MSSSSSLNFYPYPSSLNVSNFVTIKLTLENFLLWETQVVSLVESQDLMGFITGEVPMPVREIEIAGSDKLVVNPEFSSWIHTDRLVKAWITATLSEEVLGLAVGVKTAADLWHTLTTAFSVSSGDSSGETHVSIDIESIRQKLSRRSNRSLGPTSCVFRVHNRIRKINEDAYTPDMVSIGPYHRSVQKLKAMEVHKLQYVHALLDRTAEKTSLEDYVEALKELEAEARECYSDPIKLSSKEFIEMMLIDGLFILELFRKNSKIVGVDDNDPIFHSSSRRARVLRDLVLLENQIPMLVLQKLFDLSKGPRHASTLSLIGMALFFFHALIPEAMNKYPKSSNHITHNHLLDLLSYILDNSLRTAEMPAYTSTQESVPCVTELLRSGVKFNKSLKDGSWIDIKFSEGVFEIPPLCVNDYTDSFFRSLIAYEQYRFGGKPYITSYVMLMDYLINSAHDVAFLRGRGIIINQLGDDKKVSSLFSNLCSEVSGSYFYYSELCEKVNDHYNKPYNNWKATFKRDYCNSPWSIISVVAAIILLFVTIWTALFATFPVFKVGG